MAKSLRQKEINFLAVLEGRTARQKRSLSFYIAPGAILLVLLVGLGMFGFLQVNISNVNEQTEEIRTYLNSANVTKQVTEASSLKSQSASMQTQADATALPMENLASYPDLTSAEYNRILEMAGANIELSTLTFDRTTGLLAFTATSDYVLSIPTFISQMRNCGLFSDISYTGYAGSAGSSASSQLAGATVRSSSSSGSASTAAAVVPQAPRFAFSVECSVKPKVPVPDVPAEALAEAPADAAAPDTAAAGGE